LTADDFHERPFTKNVALLPSTAEAKLDLMPRSCSTITAAPAAGGILKNFSFEACLHKT